MRRGFANLNKTAAAATSDSTPPPSSKRARVEQPHDEIDANSVSVTSIPIRVPRVIQPDVDNARATDTIAPQIEPVATAAQDNGPLALDTLPQFVRFTDAMPRSAKDAIKYVRDREMQARMFIAKSCAPHVDDDDRTLMVSEQMAMVQLFASAARANLGVVALYNHTFTLGVLYPLQNDQNLQCASDSSCERATIWANYSVSGVTFEDLCTCKRQPYPISTWMYVDIHPLALTSMTRDDVIDMRKQYAMHGSEQLYDTPEFKTTPWPDFMKKESETKYTLIACNLCNPEAEVGAHLCAVDKPTIVIRENGLSAVIHARIHKMLGSDKYVDLLPYEIVGVARKTKRVTDALSHALES